MRKRCGIWWILIPNLESICPHGNFRIASGHHMRIDSDTHGYIWMLATKLFQNGQVIYIDLHAERQKLPLFLPRKHH